MQGTCEVRSKRTYPKGHQVVNHSSAFLSQLCRNPGWINLTAIAECPDTWVGLVLSAGCLPTSKHTRNTKRDAGLHFSLLIAGTRAYPHAWTHHPSLLKTGASEDCKATNLYSQTPTTHTHTQANTAKPGMEQRRVQWVFNDNTGQSLRQKTDVNATSSEYKIPSKHQKTVFATDQQV